jgi:5-methylcytosine-specific restriction enzyme A
MAREEFKQFYSSKSWKKTRESYISSVNGLCEVCLSRDKYVPGYIVHHRVEITTDNINDPNITLSHSNLQYVCLECHNQIHFAKGEAIDDELMFDSNGDVVRR